MSDFFTKLIAVHSLGPNVATPELSASGCVVMYACAVCDEEHDDEDDAIECCPRRPREIIKCAVCRESHDTEEDAVACHPAVSHSQPMQCMVCMKRADSFEDAAECCLPNHPTMTHWGRQRVAQAVASGIPWAEAVQANINH